MGIRKAFLAWLLAFVVFPVSGTARTSDVKTKFDPIAATQPVVLRVLDLLNEERSKEGLPALSLSDKLCVTARWHAMDMAVGNYFEHKDRQGRTPGQRLQSFGYRYHYCGQNIAGGQKSPEEVVDAWMKSPPHRENILRAEFKEVGIAFVENPNSKFGTYWVQDFGTP